MGLLGYVYVWAPKTVVTLALSKEVPPLYQSRKERLVTMAGLHGASELLQYDIYELLPRSSTAVLQCEEW